MSKKRKKTVGYEAFAKWEIELSKGKAKSLIGKYGFTEVDMKDLEQELLLQIFRTRKTWRSWKKVKASEKTIVSRILDNRIRNITRLLRTSKRHIHTHKESLQKYHSEDSLLTHGDILDEDMALARVGRNKMAKEKELRLSLSLAFEKLTDFQKKVCELLLKGYKISHAAKILKMNRLTLHKELRRMRKIFYQEDLDGYI